MNNIDHFELNHLEETNNKIKQIKKYIREFLLQLQNSNIDIDNNDRFLYNQLNNKHNLTYRLIQHFSINNITNYNPYLSLLDKNTNEIKKKLLK